MARSEIENRFLSGEKIPATDFCNKEGLELYGNVVHFLWRKDQSTQEPDFWGEVWHQKVEPVVILDPGQERLLRPTQEELRMHKRIV